MKTDRSQLSATVAPVGLFLSLVAAVCVGCQTRQWSWGFTLLFLGLALLAAIPLMLKSSFRLSPWLGGISVATAAWFSWRAWMSPVGETATSDFLLILMVAGGGAVAREVFSDSRRATPFLWGVCLLIASSAIVSMIQYRDPSFAPILRTRPYVFPSGFFGHYNECANFFIGGSLLLGAFALKGHHSIWTRTIWGLVSLTGGAGVFLSHSRGGLLALVVGLLLGLVLLAITGRRSRWFGITLIVVPVVALLAVAFLAKGWEKAQQARGPQIADAAGYSLTDEVLGNPIRLTFLEIAAEAVSRAPLAGSGSGSFGWNVYQLWDTEVHGGMQSRPETVHNELMQAATDYGILGAGLVLILLATLGIQGGIKCFIPEPGSEHLAPAIVGGMSGLAGMFIQSCFSSVFHLPPGALLLGVCMGALSAGTISSSPPARIRWIFPGLPMLAAGGILIAMSVPRIRMTTELWHLYFKGRSALSTWEMAHRLEAATRVIPLPSTLAELGTILFRISRSDDPMANEAEEQAIEAYSASVEGNPKNPTASFNLANLLSNAGRDNEAENEYRRTVQLQGTSEGLFLGHFRLAEHYLRKGIRELNQRQPDDAIRYLDSALLEIDASDKLAPWLIQGSHQGITLVSDVNENLGFALETTGNLEGALEHYHAAARIFPKSHYHIGRVMESIARTHWSERRSSQALWTYQKALEHLRMANPLPNGVQETESLKRITQIEATIRFLTEAGIQPIER